MPSDEEKYARELALKQYDVIAKNLMAESAIYWSRAQLFLVANAAMLGFLSRVPLADNHIALPTLVAIEAVAFVGIGLSVLWHMALAAGEDWHRHWIKHARAFEEAAFGEVLLLREDGGNRRSVKRVARLCAWLFTVAWGAIAVTAGVAICHYSN